MKQNSPLARTFSPRFGDTAGLDQGAEFPVFCTEKRIRNFRLFVDNQIESPQDARYIIEALESAEEEDFVTLHLNSPGGSVSAGQAILHSLSTCRAPVHVVASGEICSMAAIILAAAESFEVAPYSSILFHSVSFGAYGKSIDNVEYSVFVHKQMKEMLAYHTIGILTSQEIDMICDLKKELWMTDLEFIERFKRKTLLQRQLSDALDSAEDLSDSQKTPQLYIEMMMKLMEGGAEEKEKKVTRKRKAVAKAVEVEKE